jgi:hypothetical protein
MSDDLVRRLRGGLPVCEEAATHIEALETKLAKVSAERDAAIRGKECFQRMTRAHWEALCAMRNSINEHIPMPNTDSGPLFSPEDGPIYADIAERVVARIEALEAQLDAIEEEGTESLNALPDCLMKLAPALVRVDELEAKLAQAVDALDRIAHASDVYGDEARAEDQGAETLAYAHKSTCNLARATIAAIKGEANDA